MQHVEVGESEDDHDMSEDSGEIIDSSADEQMANQEGKKTVK
jgi:hypothetical protein